MKLLLYNFYITGMGYFFSLFSTFEKCAANLLKRFDIHKSFAVKCTDLFLFSQIWHLKHVHKEQASVQKTCSFIAELDSENKQIRNKSRLNIACSFSAKNRKRNNYIRNKLPLVLACSLSAKIRRRNNYMRNKLENTRSKLQITILKEYARFFPRLFHPIVPVLLPSSTLRQRVCPAPA